MNHLFLVTDVLQQFSTKGEKLIQGLKFSLVGFLVVFLALAILAIFIKIVDKIFVAKKAKKNAAETDKKESEASAPAEHVSIKKEGPPLPDTESEGELSLVNVDDETAAVIMAIVADRSGIPLNRLEFKSIRLLEDK